MIKTPTLTGITLLFCLSILISLESAEAQGSNPAITRMELERHLRFLADDRQEGRLPSGKADTGVVRYLADAFASFGLEPKGDGKGYTQKFTFTSNAILNTHTRFNLVISSNKIPAQLGTDFRPLAYSARGKGSGPVVFAGYGIETKAKGIYNDYEGIDARGKVVMVFRGAPESDEQYTDFGAFRSLRFKAAKAREMGAVCLLVVSGPLDEKVDTLLPFRFDQQAGRASIPVIHVSQALASRILGLDLSGLRSLQDSINTYKRPLSRELKVQAEFNVRIDDVVSTGHNIVGLVRGADPVLRNQYVVVGAHYDHLGYGGEGSGSLAPDQHDIHNGADDNASGTAALLEIAQKVASTRGALKRSVLFIAFGAEESGLLGSSHFVESPTVPLQNIVSMLNMDMVGRLTDRTLTVFGVGTSASFEPLLTGLNADSGFVLQLSKDGMGPSDHASFYRKKIPVLHFFTGTHTDYHRPSDDVDKINWDGLTQVTGYVDQVLHSIQKAEKSPEYIAVEAPRQGGTMAGIRSFTGVIPDYSEDKRGLKINGVREGSPAQKAGLAGGDVVTRFGKVEVKSIYDYMYALSQYGPGADVLITVIRKEKEESFRMIVGKRD